MAAMLYYTLDPQFGALLYSVASRYERLALLPDALACCAYAGPPAPTEVLAYAHALGIQLYTLGENYACFLTQGKREALKASGRQQTAGGARGPLPGGGGEVHFIGCCRWHFSLCITGKQCYDYYGMTMIIMISITTVIFIIVLILNFFFFFGGGYWHHHHYSFCCSYYY